MSFCLQLISTDAECGLASLDQHIVSLVLDVIYGECFGGKVVRLKIQIISLCLQFDTASISTSIRAILVEIQVSRLRWS